MTEPATATEARPAPLKAPVRSPVKAAYGLGSLVDGVAGAVVGTFLFFYFTAVLGLSGSMVGAAAAISLVVDAAVDPLLGSWSDNTRSRWGRRIPFMIVGAPLAAIALGLLFSPPHHLAPLALFAWLLALSLLLRAAGSTFNVPFIALGAEISDDYAERSSVVAWRTVFSIFGALAVSVLGLLVFLSKSRGGQLYAPGYAPLAWTSAVLMLAGGDVCVFGIRRFAAGLPVTAVDPTAMHRRFAGEVVEVFKNPSFRVLFATLVLFFVGQGVAATLSVHMNVFVWKINSTQILVTTVGYLGGLLVGVPLTPLLSRHFEKRTLVLGGLTVLALVQGVLTGLRALHLFTVSGAAVVLPLTLNVFVGGIGVTFAAISFASMMADAADEHDFLFRRRREGLYFAGLGFAAKAATGLGALIGGIGLDLIRFPRNLANQGAAAHIAIAPQTLDALAVVAGPAVALISIIAISLLFLYRIDRRRHEEVVKVLVDRRAAAEG
jgi:GPH family glycoside/pentoside/hexuronide:cation symporter